MVHRLDSVVGPRYRPLLLALGAMLVSLSVLCVQLVLLQAGLVRAQGTLDVCSGCTYESIQEAIDAADPGDTIRVAQGVYTENLVITKSLTVKGGYESTGWIRDIELYETTIDGNRSGSVISVTNGCSTTIDGFTMANGATDRGGGIYVDSSSVVVTNNRIEHNITWFTREAVTITEPLLAGATVVSGTCDPKLVDEVYVWDVTTDSYIGSDHAEPEGTFSVSFWIPLTEGHVIGAFGAYGYDEAVVQPALGVSQEASVPGDADMGTGYPHGFFSDGAASRGDTEDASRLEGLSGDLGQDEEFSLRGGGIYLLDSTALITGNEIVSNTARDFGGGICAENSTVSIAGNDVISNTSGRNFPIWWWKGYGGGVAILAGSRFTVADNLLAENVVMRGGGGVYIAGSEGSIAGNQIAGNDAFDGMCPRGGGIYVEDCSPVIEGNVILSNTVAVLGYPAIQAYGGGVYLLGSSALVTDNEIAGNLVHVAGGGGNSSDDAQGGGIFAGDSLSLPCSHVPTGSGDVWPVMVSNVIVGNAAESPKWADVGIGGGVSAYGVSASLWDNEIVENFAGYDGGGISVFQYQTPSYGHAVTAAISGNQVVGNVVEGGSGYGGGVGGMALWSVTGTVDSNVVVGNRAPFVGGMSICGPWALVQGNHVASNVAEDIGGVSAAGADRAIFTGNTIIENTGSSLAGGIEAGNGSFVFSHNEIISNTGRYGGGISLGWTPTSVTLEANAISANQASRKGGGIFVWPDAVLTMTNNVIADNSAEELGGGIYVSDSHGTLINNTIAENEEGAGEGIYLDGTAEATILNNIIVSHTYGVYNAGSGAADVTYNDVWGNSVSDYYGVTPGTGNISSDPGFVDPGNWDYHLWTTSPAVDAGHPDAGLAPSVDIDGDSRPMGSRVDMGADEVPFEVWVWKSDLPDPVLPGELVTYTIEVLNGGEWPATGVVITDRVPLDTEFAWVLDGGELVGDEVRWTGLIVGPGESLTVHWGATVTEHLLVGEIVNESYGTSCSETSKVVMGEAVHTSILRHKLILPLAVKERV